MTHRVFFVMVDAIRDSGGGWTWNHARSLGSQRLSSDEVDKLYDSRFFLKSLRDRGFLSKESKGKCVVEVSEGDPTFIEVLDRGSRMPLVAAKIFWGHPSDPS